jgi:hypothetical protein
LSFLHCQGRFVDLAIELLGMRNQTGFGELTERANAFPFLSVDFYEEL